MKIDADKLAEIANAAKKEKQNRKNQQAALTAQKRRNQKKEAEEKAKQIIASIPQELEEAAKKAIATKKGLLITAKILIVREKFSSIMQSRGYLLDEDEMVLQAVRQLLKKCEIAGVELTEISEEHEGGWQASDGDTTTGLCTHYIIKAETLIKNSKKK